MRKWSIHSSCEKNTGQNHEKKAPNKSFESVVKFTYFGMTTMSHNCILEDTKSRLTLENAGNHLAQNVLLFNLLYKNINVKIHRILILPVGLYGYKNLVSH
jgi:hypothetical protein